MQDFEDTYPMDEGSMHSFFCGDCGQLWSFSELIEEGQLVLQEDSWRCPGCLAVNCA